MVRKQVEALSCAGGTVPVQNPLKHSDAPTLGAETQLGPFLLKPGKFHRLSQWTGDAKLLVPDLPQGDSSSCETGRPSEPTQTVVELASCQAGLFARVLPSLTRT